MTIVDRYFELVDDFRTDEQLQQFVELFTPDAVLTPAQGDPMRGRDGISAGQRFFYDNVSAASKHFYEVTSVSKNRIEANWAVAARMHTGGLLTLQGHNTYEIDEASGLISSLTVVNAPSQA